MQQQGNPYNCTLVKLPQGETKKEYHLDESFLEQYECSDEILAIDADAEVLMDRRGDRWSVSIYIEGSMDVPCSRCLEALSLPLNEEYRMHVEYGDERKESETEEADLLVLPYQEQGKGLDLGDIIRDTLLLAIPYSCCHEEGACNKEMRDLLDDYMTAPEGDED